ncbi:superinfection immunity protein [Streptomyces brevispora]|uniref:superinfection immunity protein n=1 Tax=Streptomyces brevispora TaxID=887462 RepID=UPI0033F32B9E
MRRMWPWWAIRMSARSAAVARAPRLLAWIGGGGRNGRRHGPDLRGPMTIGSFGGLGPGPTAVIVVARFVPTAVAFARGVPNKGSVLVMNLVLGWTVGGGVSLAMAARSDQPRPHMRAVRPCREAP